VATEQAAYASLLIDVLHRRHHAEPTSGIFGKLRVRRLEKDLDSIEGPDNCFGGASCKPTGKSGA